jgi:uncharacterized repeat protein (TIGR01451 family)
MKPFQNKTPIETWIAAGIAWSLMIFAAIALLLLTAPALAQDGTGAGAALAQQAPSLAGPAEATSPVSPEHGLAPKALAATRVSTPTLPGWVVQLLERGPASPSATDLVVHKSAVTGSGDNSIAYEGEYITYTLVVSNPSSVAAKDLLILDVLPKGTLTNVGCSDGCAREIVTQEIPGPLGDVVVVTATHQVSWMIGTLDSQQSVARHFWGRVIGQPDGAVFSNRAFIHYQQGTSTKSGLSNDLQTTVRVRIAQNGKATLSNAATWLSEDYGGTLSLDWGDFDQDGYLDLALGSTIGTSVYRNDHGRLVKFWGNDLLTYGVRWADLDRDGGLELIAVGGISPTNSLAGLNYIYEQSGNTFQGIAFPSPEQLVRVAPGDFDGDGYVDLVVAANSFNVPCPVRWYRNTTNPAKPFAASGECVSTEASAALGPVDFGNDGKLDLALGRFPNETDLLVNTGVSTAPLTVTNGFAVDQYAVFLPYDYSWGDYDGDGYLDLASAFPLDRKVRIYHNQAGKGLKLFAEITTSQFGTPRSVDWGDFNGDGRPELAVADAPPKVYRYDGSAFDSTPILALPLDAVQGEVWSMRTGDQDNDGDLDLAVSNRDGPSGLFTNFAPLLGTRLEPIAWSGSTDTGSVAWGDTNNDGYLDLLFGAGPASVATKLYLNQDGSFPLSTAVPFYATGFGPHAVAFGDVTGDGKLDVAIALATPAAVQLYYAGNTTAPNWSSAPPDYTTYSLAWGDVDSDGDLDLLVGNDGPNALYLNSDKELAATPAWRSVYTDVTRSVAWGDYNGDRYLDFAVGNYGQPNRVYRNNHDGTFSESWTSVDDSNTTSLAWADYDADGDLDLVVGNYGQFTLLYANDGGTLSTTPAWHSLAPDKTTGVAWGDWNNDGYLDLAIGNDGQPDKVYANLGSRPGSTPQLYWLWASAESNRTTGVAWGDRDDDGDQDLAISRKGTGQNGVYVNNYVVPSHLVDDFARTLPLLHNSPYVWVRKPGSTQAAYFYSSAALLSGPQNPTVTVEYKLYDADGTRNDAVSPSNVAGVEIVSTTFEFSLDGGVTWRPATPITPQVPITTTRRLGEKGTFLWDAVADAAISDDARFRVTIVPDNLLGPVNRSAVSGISPPFRVRGTTCTWPKDPFIVVGDPDPVVGEAIRFEGGVIEGSGVLSYTWAFGDGSTDQGQVVSHTFYRARRNLVRLTVTSQPCPVAFGVVATRTLVVGTGAPRSYLPAVFRTYTATTSSTASAPLPVVAATTGALDLQPPPNPAPAAPAAAPSSPEAPLPSPIVDYRTTMEGLRAAAGSSLGVFPITADTIGVNNTPSMNASGRQVAFWSTGDLAASGDNADGSIEVFRAEIGSITGATVPVTFTQITNSSGNILGGFNLGPSIDDAGDRIAFFSDRDLTGLRLNPDANFEIFVADVGPTVVITQLTRTREGSNILPSLSADGQHVAFVSDRNLSGSNPDGNQEIFLYDFGLRRFTQVSNTGGGVINDEPDVNADGTRLAYISDAQLVVADVGHGGTVTRRTVANPTGGTNRQPSIDAAGDRVAFRSSGDIYMANVPAAGEITTTPIARAGGGTTYDEPAISADGTRIAYVATDSSSATIMFYDTGVGAQRELRGAPHARHPSLSADGTQFAIVSGREIWIAASPRADVGIAKFSHPTPLVPGLAVTYTLIVTNGGPSSVGGVTVTDRLPGSVLTPTWTCTTTLGITCTVPLTDPTTLTDVVFLQPGATITYVVSGELDPAALGSLANTAVVTLPQDATDWQPDNNRAVVTSTMLPQADLGVVKAPGEDPVVPGTALTYTLTVSNAGPSVARDVVVTDTLPPEVVFVTATQPFTRVLPDLVWAIKTLDPGEIQTRIVKVDVPSSLILPFVNTVQVTSVTSETRPSNNRINVPTDVDPQVDLTLAKTHHPDPAAPGAALTYVLVVTKTGPSDAVGVVVTDTLPAGVQVADATPPYSLDPGGNVIWNLGTLVGGLQTRTLTVTVDIQPSLTQTTITNTAVVTSTTRDTDPTNNDVSELATLEAEADLSVAKTGTPGPVATGDTLTYTLFYANGGPSDAQDVVITDTLPPDVRFVGVIGASPPISGPTQSGQEMVWRVPTLAAGASGAIDFTARVSDVVGSLLDNHVVVTSTATDPVPGNNHDTYTVTVEADLAITKTGVADNKDLTYLITVTNAGPGSLAGALVYDRVPDNVFKGNPTWSCTADNGSSCTAPDPGLLLSDTVTVLANGTLVYTVTGTPRFKNATAVTNTAWVTAPLWITDPDLANNHDDEVLVPADLSATKTVDDPRPDQDGQIVYTIAVFNEGPDVASNLSLTDPLPAGVAYVTSRPTAGTYDPGTGVWSLAGRFPPGPVATLWITATVTAGPGTTVTNTVTSLTAEKPPDLNQDNNTPQVAFTVNSPPTARPDEPASPAVWDSPKTIYVLANDSDPDGDPISLSTVGVPLSGTAVIGPANDTVVYTPDHFTGTDTFTYTVGDGSLFSTGTVTVTVRPFTVTVQAPPSVVSGTGAIFTATVHVAATTPLTYVWQATGQVTPTVVTHTDIAALADTAVFTWTEQASQTVIVTVSNIDGQATGVFSLTVPYVPSSLGWLPYGQGRWIYLPLVRRGGGRDAGP